MSRIALLSCTSVFLLGTMLQAFAAPPTEQKRRVPQAVAKPAAVRTAAKPAAKPVVTARPVARPAAPVRSVKTAAKPSTPVVARNPKSAPQPKPQTVAKAPAKPVVAKPDTRQAAAVRRPGPAFDRSTRSNLLPAGSPQLALQKGPQALPAVAGSRAGTVKKIAGAAVGAAVIGAGIAAVAKPAAANASQGPAGAVRPAVRPPLANLNHPHLKPVARVLPSIIGHKHANRPRLPLFVLAPALLGASWMGREFYVWNRRSYDNVGWIAPIPTCYVGGTVFYRDPWSGDCFNFEAAEPGDRFAVGTKVYTWSPAKYPSVEDMVDDQERSGAGIMSEPFRIANPTPRATRVSVEAVSRPVVAALGLEATDCSSCLTAIGPVEVTGGQCSVTISNNCSLAVAFDVEFQRNDQTFCQTKLDAAGASEVIVCTQPCTTFLESRVNLKSALPKLANTAPFKGCRPHWAAVAEQAR
jgi:hypothetical protein